ncbi:MAG: hypothetical protein DRQ88_08335 [Epsilonproteobacteria bacterium]|nr:MAG: hypothetical protein DRQ89_06685 [Campylobacterota bacterium]RLA65936.1 MAG: hypothetical protein DRQ88_08335 [Campylobacterota bacterium]
MKKQRYKTLKSYPGIRKELKTGRYYVTKSIKGKRISKTFDNFQKARHWKNAHNPLVKTAEEIEAFPPKELNGKDKGFLVKDVWDKYEIYHLVGLSFGTREVVQGKAKFLCDMMKFRMVELDPDFFDHYVNQQLELAKVKGSRRYNFDEELKRTKAFLNWYRENYDYSFVNPILKRHFVAGTLRAKIEKNKKLNKDQVNLFFGALPVFWQDFARVQFYMGARVSETAGLTWEFVDLVESVVEIRKVAIWSRKTKQFQHLKDLPKNGEARFCHINETMLEILKNRLKCKLDDGDFVFHDNGMPLKYRQIQYQYNKALKKVGLYPEFQSTHILRHSMATITRKVTKSLEATQAVTGHKDQRLVQHYATLPEEAQKQAVNDVEKFMNSGKRRGLQLIKS